MVDRAFVVSIERTHNEIWQLRWPQQAPSDAFYWIVQANADDIRQSLCCRGPPEKGKRKGGNSSIPDHCSLADETIRSQAGEVEPLQRNEGQSYDAQHVVLLWARTSARGCSIAGLYEASASIYMCNYNARSFASYQTQK